MSCYALEQDRNCRDSPQPEMCFEGLSIKEHKIIK